MVQKLEINIPNELIKEIEVYAKGEGITLNEFLFWALGEKVGELRERRGVKNLIRVNPSQPPEKPIVDKAQPPSSAQKRLLKAEEVAKYLRLSKSGAYHLMRTGVIPVVRIGKAVRVREEDIDNFVLNSKV
jgi:excisionase family DNA binding protein